ncbi:MAG: SDR family oxidoreductase [Nitrososphaerales archaeon]
MANVLVVGGAGYVGGAVTDQLMQTSHNVRVYDSLLYEDSFRKPVSFVLGDIRDEEKLLAHLRWADVVVWLAAIVGDGACALNPDIATEINQHGVARLAKHFDGRIVFLSTCSVYGAQESELDESSPTNPLSVYAATKLAAEQSLTNQNAISFRLGTLYGIGDLFSRVRLDLVVNTLVVKAFTQGRITVYGGGQHRPLLHVKDAAQAIVENIETDHCGIVNLHHENVQIIDLAFQFRNHFPDVEIECTEMKFLDARNYRVSSKKAISTFGFHPKYTVDDGIVELKTLLEEGRLKDIGDPRYSNHHLLKKTLEPLHE